MAKLTTDSRYDVDQFDLNQYYENFDAKLKRNNVFDPYEDNFTVWTTEVAFKTWGTNFGYNTRGEMVKGQIEAFGEFYWSDAIGDWEPTYRVDNVVQVGARRVFDASQTNSTRDDFSLLARMLSGNDRFNLSGSNDNAKGFDGNDRMYGFAGNDSLRGGDGNDKLYGGNDNDVLRGGNGVDLLRGGRGVDKLVGGNGEDIFKFNTGDGADVILDMDAWGDVHDVIDLSGLDSVRNWSDLKNNHMFKDGKDVVIDAGNGDVLTIRDTGFSSMDKGDFIF